MRPGTPTPRPCRTSSAFRQLIRAEQARRDFFREGRLPQFLAPPEGAVRTLLEASVRVRAGRRGGGHGAARSGRGAEAEGGGIVRRPAVPGPPRPGRPDVLRPGGPDERRPLLLGADRGRGLDRVPRPVHAPRPALAERRPDRPGRAGGRGLPPRPLRGHGGRGGRRTPARPGDRMEGGGRHPGPGGRPAAPSSWGTTPRRSSKSRPSRSTSRGRPLEWSIAARIGAPGPGGPDRGPIRPPPPDSPTGSDGPTGSRPVGPAPNPRDDQCRNPRPSSR